MEPRRIIAILPAGGVGLRANVPTPKQFWMIGGKPLLYYTLEVFESASFIDSTVLVVSKDRLASMRADVKQWRFIKIIVAEGGETRHQSIYAGLRAAAAAEAAAEASTNAQSAGVGQGPDVAIVHDVVRPFVSHAVLREVASAACKFGAAGTILPLISTVVAVDDSGFLTHSLDRSKFRASQTPQAFHRAVLAKAYSKCTADDFKFGTECLHLAQTYGGVAKVKLVEGTPDLFKVTHKQDLFACEQMLKLRAFKVACVTGASRGIGKEVARLLSQRGLHVIMIARGADELKQAAAEIKGFPVVADMSKSEEVKRVFHSVAAQHGRLDICINCAGVAANMPIAGTSDEAWKEMMDGNLSSTFYCCREALHVMISNGSSSGGGGKVTSTDSNPAVAATSNVAVPHGHDDAVKDASVGAGELGDDMGGSSSARGGGGRVDVGGGSTVVGGGSGRRGVIVNVGSSSTNGGRRGQAAYASSKAGIQSLTETLALEGKDAGVLAYCVVPSRTDTTLRSSLKPEEGGAGCLKPWDVAEVIVSCATAANPLLSGHSFWLK